MTLTTENGLISQDQLKDWVDVKSKLKLEKWLNKNRIPFTFNAKGHVITTLQAVNNSVMNLSMEGEVTSV